MPTYSTSAKSKGEPGLSSRRTGHRKAPSTWETSVSCQVRSSSTAVDGATKCRSTRASAATRPSSAAKSGAFSSNIIRGHPSVPHMSRASSRLRSCSSAESPHGYVRCPRGARHRAVPGQGECAIRIRRCEHRERGTPGRGAEQGRASRSARVEDGEEVSSPRFEVRETNAAARESAPSTIVQDRRARTSPVDGTGLRSARTPRASRCCRLCPKGRRRGPRSLRRGCCTRCSPRPRSWRTASLERPLRPPPDRGANGRGRPSARVRRRLRT